VLSFLSSTSKLQCSSRKYITNLVYASLKPQTPASKCQTPNCQVNYRSKLYLNPRDSIIHQYFFYILGFSHSFPSSSCILLFSLITPLTDIYTTITTFQPPLPRSNAESSPICLSIMACTKLCRPGNPWSNAHCGSYHPGYYFISHRGFEALHQVCTYQERWAG